MAKFAENSDSRHSRRQSPDDALACVKVGADRRRCALALLLTGRPSEHDPAVDPFLQFVAQHKLSLDELWTAQRHGDLLASMLIVPSPGRTAMVFLSPLTKRSLRNDVVELVRMACATQDSTHLHLMQALFDPNQVDEADALEAAGFTALAELTYMQRGTRAKTVPLRLDASVRWVHWAEKHRSCFADTILASYEGTMDCPGLVGLRHIDDIIAGHMATGTFKPQFWFALHQKGKPMAVMLLNLVPRQDAIELVYLGVCPRWRGQGIGRKLLLHGIGLARRYGISKMILAVDRGNKPALRLYESLEFASTARKLAMIFPLLDQTSASVP